MRHLNRVLLAICLAVGISAGAGAATLVLQDATLGISIGALPAIEFPCAGCPHSITVTAVGPGNGFDEPANVFTGSVLLPTGLFTGVPLINGLTIGNVGNAVKNIDPGQAAGPRGSLVIRQGGGIGGPGALQGAAFVNVLGLFNLAVPLNVIGSTNGQTSVAAGSLAVTVRATGWTENQVQVDNITTDGGNTVTFVGFDNRTPNGTGVVQLISPFHVTTNAAGNLPGLAVQTLTFGAPEPGEILLVGAALGSIALLARRRLRR
jgi:hypothetical protein